MDLENGARRAARGDESAFAELVVATQVDIWRFCSHLVGPSRADDATQETFLAAWRAIHQFRGDASIRTWLFAIARRCALASERRDRRSHEWHLRHAEYDISRESDPQLRSEIFQLLLLIPKQRRTALVLTQVFGFSYAETSNICQCPIGTVRSRVARARRELMDLMVRDDKEWLFESDDAG